MSLMGDTIPANNEEFFVINRGIRWKLIICPVCGAAHFRTYKELIYHMLWPTNCTNNINQRNQILENNQIGPMMVPVTFFLRLILMLLWSIIWLCYQVYYYIIVVLFMFIYNAIVSVVLFVADLFQRYYGPVRNAFSAPALLALPIASAGGLFVYIYEVAKACVQLVRNLPGQFYQNIRDTVANTIVPFGWSILMALYPVYHYIFGVPYTYISGAIASVRLYIADIPERVSQYCTNAFASTFQAAYPVYQRTIRLPIARFRICYIEPLIDTVRYIIAAPGRGYQQAKYLVVVKFPATIDSFIGSERAFVKGVFIRVEDRLRQIYEGIGWLNSALYSFIYFPVDVPVGTTFWMRFVYRAFFCIHVIILAYMCICCYIQLAVLFISNVAYVQ